MLEVSAVRRKIVPNQGHQFAGVGRFTGRRVAVTVAAVGLAAALIAGCSTASGSTGSSGSSGFSAYLSCLRQHGVSVPTSPSGAPGGFGGFGGFGGSGSSSGIASAGPASARHGGV